MKSRAIPRGLIFAIAAAIPLLALRAQAADEPDAKWLEKSRQAGLSPEVQRGYQEIAKLRVWKLTRHDRRAAALEQRCFRQG